MNQNLTCVFAAIHPTINTASVIKLDYNNCQTKHIKHNEKPTESIANAHLARSSPGKQDNSKKKSFLIQVETFFWKAVKLNTELICKPVEFPSIQQKHILQLR